MFYEQLKKACKEKGTGITALIRKLQISSGNAASWKSGVIPKSDTIDLLAKELGVSTDYLIREEDISIQVSDKSSVFSSLKAVPQRWLSLRPSKDISSAKMLEIANYLHSDVFFFFDDNESNYKYIECDKANDSVIFDILDILDSCAESEKYRRLQLQISKIVIYWLDKAGYGYDFLISDECKMLSKDKVDFICNNTKHLDSTFDYGFNFTDLCVIREKTQLEFTYLLTGQK